MTCNGNATEYCGGGNRLNVYQVGTTAGAATSAAPPVGGAGGSTAIDQPTKTTALGASTTSPVTAATGLPQGWSYKGCYIDNANGGRILANTQPDNKQLTVESCSTACQKAGYKVAGMEYSTQCFCGNAIIQGGAPASSDNDCGMTCGGNANEKCGGPNRMSIYSNDTLVVMAPPVPQKTGLPGSWTYAGCLSEGTNGRVFKYQLILPDTNDAQNCLSQCSKFGFPAGGMEYGQECYCGDLSDVTAAGATLKPETDCQTACPGDARYLCGGGNRMSYYTWTGSPLSQFTVASGNNAGQYKFLIGGVVVPLITTAGINGKVTFVEKFGTGPPNSTGAYELDLTKVDDFANAWRPMHVKTDVFCSAGLILPDKAGRVINVGGWSLQSTYGIRLYVPDGSPGVPGKNDWQENYQEVSLQNGRWYPSAMIMANGSILVVGGENGSNGPPVPTLEILPKPAGATVFFADWLNQTDPYNLYPFTAVLPSGGIFAAYYNQARVLDAGTLGTTKTLPQIPGSVNNPLSGRTYPFEGTQVLMPQVAPYSDPLTILLCGGSNPGAAIAVDNCVSIQPDVANPQWTIERMPSQRVMTCIAPLPDGTYLILNGAKQGTAGFGLATNPNLNAVLYDPSKPFGTRFTIMANTTVARLYHSEAILLQDGRVLVSGSDPEDGKNPQEYRVEQFLPPYLLSGLPKPTFTIQNKDWAYGQQATFTVTAGSTANLKVSLMGGVSSTHGNSMGARTIFPAVSCAGNTCTVTAPPNANVCPPGWFQMFVLDGPTPSNSYWIRIGGDPAKLGNWPNFPDFTLPGV